MGKKMCRNLAKPINEVMDNVEDFIIQENIRAIEYLWNLNILTTQTNNYDNDFSWIAIGKLDEENEKIFRELSKKYAMARDNEPIIGSIYGGRGFSVPVVPGTRDVFEDFMPLFKDFKMQDVQKDGYMTVEEFYIKCTDCWSVIDNPNRHPLPTPKKGDFPSVEEYCKAYDAYLESLEGLSKIKVFDPNKCVKGLNEYLADANLLDCYDEEEGKIFYNRRLYEGHMRYKAFGGNGKKQSI